MISAIFDPNAWEPVPGTDFSDITYHRAKAHGTVRIAFNRPEVRNAFRPQTVDELYRALDHARMTADVGVVLLTGNGPSPKDGGWAFCSGGDQRIRGRDGYYYAGKEGVDPARTGRLHILEVQRLIRFMPKVVIADPADRRQAGTQQQVSVIGDQGPGKTIRLRLFQHLPQALYKGITIHIVPKDFSAFNTADDDMVQRAGAVNSCFSWHIYSNSR